MRIAPALAVALAASSCSTSSGGAGSGSSGGGGGGAPASGAQGSGTGSAGPPLGTPSVHFITPDVRSLPEPKIDLPQVGQSRVVDAGAAPRAALRYQWSPDTHREVTVEAALRTHRLSDGRWTDPVDVPPVREGFGFAVAPGKDGAAQLSFRGLDAAIVGTPDAAGTARATEYLATFRGLIEHRRGTIAVDDHGVLRSAAFNDALPDEGTRAVDEVEQRWIAAAVPLPAEPVGKGAKWRVITLLRAGAAVVKQTADYTLVEVRPDRWIIDEDIRRIGQDQLVDPGGLPAGAVAELIALYRATTGRVEVSPTLPWPIAGAVQTELRAHLRVGVPGDQAVHEDITEDTGTLTFTSR